GDAKNRRLRGAVSHSGGAAQRRVASADVCQRAFRRVHSELLPVGKPARATRPVHRGNGRRQRTRRPERAAQSAGGSGARAGDQSGLLEKEPGAGGGVLGVKASGFFVFFVVPTTACPAATIAGRVIDAETGATIPATIAILASDGAPVTDHPSFQAGFRSSGTFEKEVPAGETSIVVSRGFDYVAVQRRLTLAADERRSETFVLQRRSSLRREGWYCGDNHDHMIHGERTVLVDFPYVALAARAEGLDYLAVAQGWNISNISPEELERVTRALSMPGFTLTWNLEAPKNYWRGDAAHTLGHGWTVGMRGRTTDGRDAIDELLALSAMDYESGKPTVPNFEIQALIHSLGGVTAYSHPARWWRGKWGGQGIYPVEENKFISNMAAELPFDTVSGPTYDAIDILMPPQELKANQEALKLWFLLLNHGYHIAATGSSDATFDRPGGGVPGKVRVYTHLDGGVEMPRVAAAIAAGRSFVTSGPLLVLEIGGGTSGSVVTLPAPTQRAEFVRGPIASAGSS